MPSRTSLAAPALCCPLGQQWQQTIEREPAKVTLLAVGAIVGGFAVGAAAFEAQRQGKLPTPLPAPEEQTLGEGLLAFAAANVGLILGGHALLEAMRELGRQRFLEMLGLYGGAVAALSVVVSLLRQARGNP
jgi:hypothetical protein